MDWNLRTDAVFDIHPPEDRQARLGRQVYKVVPVRAPRAHDEPHARPLAQRARHQRQDGPQAGLEEQDVGAQDEAPPRADR